MGVNILVAHGGGPTAVINTSLQGVVEAAGKAARWIRSTPPGLGQREF